MTFRILSGYGFDPGCRLEDSKGRNSQGVGIITGFKRRSIP